MRVLRRILFYLLWLALAGAASASVLIFATFLYFWPGLQDEVAQLQDIDALLNEQLEIPLRVYTADHQLIAEFGEHRRTWINHEDIPQRYIDALLAAEDANFYHHPGVDIRGLARAALQLMHSGSIQSGGSTITMQVARNYLLSLDRTFTRKIREIFLSLRMEQLLSKEEILELYVNKIYLGNRAYGIVAAAEVYYGRPLHELGLTELAMLAGLPKAPSAYNPLANPRRAMIRRNWILSRMYALDMLDDVSFEQAIRTPDTARFYPRSVAVDAPYVAEAARVFAQEQFGDQAYTRGLNVYTSIISEQQLAANRAVNQGILNYDQRHGWRGVEQQGIPSVMTTDLQEDELAELEASNITSLEQIEQALQDQRAVRLAEIHGEDFSHWLQVLDRTPVYGGLEPAIVMQAEADNIQVLRRGGEVLVLQAADFAWAGQYHSPFWKDREAPRGNRLAGRGDLIRLRATGNPEAPWQLAQLPQLEAALIGINTQTGEVTALVGGFDFQQSRFNRAMQAARQVGSVFKPFIYLAAIEKGYTPATIINDAPIVFEDQLLEDSWRPQNHTGTYYGPVRLREGLYRSLNLVSIRVLNYVGINNAVRYLGRFGFNMAQLPRDLSLSLGSAAMTPLEMTQGYAILANGGYQVEAHLVTRIESSEGEVLYQAIKPRVCYVCTPDQPLVLEGQDYPLAARQVDPRAVYTLHSILRDVIDEGTGRRAQALQRRDIRGKTGTTNEQHDAWFAGFNRDFAAVVWAGFDQPSPTGEYGANLALPMWIEFMNTALQNMPEAQLERPEGLVAVRIDPQTGLRARPGQQDAMFEIFYQERVPAAANDSGSNLSAPGGMSQEELLSNPEALF